MCFLSRWGCADNAWQAAAVLAAFAFAPVAAAAPPAGKVDYNFQVRPILADRCFVCHGPDEKKRKAKLRLDVPEVAFARRALVPHKPEQSAVVERITADDDMRMPPPKSNLHLSKDEIELLRRWIAEGAEYRPHWAFLPLPDAVPLPAVADKSWPAGGLDHFILARLEREGLRPSPPAAKEDWIRRASFDLTGLPPAPAEVDAFLADTSPRAFEKVADRLLASPRYGERMAMEWLDVARFADSFGYQADGDSNVWPWRDWVIAAFNDNLSFDRFLTWQIAGDLLPRPTRQQRLATAFCRLHRMTNEGGSIPEEWRNEYVSDRVHTFGTAFLALTLECCRCHDHKYDPLTMKDYYGLGAFFNSIDEWGTYDNAHFRPTPTLPLPTAEQEKTLAALSREVREREGRLRQMEQAREPAFRQWLARGDARPDLPGLVGYYPLDGATGNHQLPNVADPANPGSTSPANAFVPGKVGKALRFTGDDPAHFPKVAGSLDRPQPFAVSFWLQTPEVMKQGIVFHRQAGTDTGFHGTELSFDDGRLFFALTRFWPGNALAVRTRTPLPAKEWVHVAVSHDASGKAAGLNVYLNGKRADTEVVRDNLTKDTEVGGGVGHGGGGSGLVFGERFRSPGLKGGLLDELRVFARSLTPIEIAHLHDGKSLIEAFARKDEAALRPYYLGAVDGEVSKAREELRQTRRRLFAAQTGVFEVLTMEEMAQPRPAYVLARGNYDAPKDRPVGRQTPAALPPFPADAPRNRLGLARWLTDPHHPLTARVAVNRYWQTFFGRGLVATTENFGTQGALPTHPELLDFLARDLIASGWDVKGLCKKIVLSSTYRQRSAAPPALRERDPENLLLARGPSRRLPAEMLRDQALCVGGLLAEKIGGPPVKPYQPPGLWRGMNAFLPDYVADKGEGLHRRSLYTFWRRTSPPPNMLAFDAPSREVCVVRRQSTSTPLQPLVLLNDPQFVEAARGLGERLLREGGTTLDERLTHAFRLAATRRPTAREVRLLAELYAAQREIFRKDPAAAKKFLRTGERPPPAGLDPIDLAAAAATAGALLNLDASLTTR
jgi:mono/diheme cytochrome c family protein